MNHLPQWLKSRYRASHSIEYTLRILNNYSLNSVCQSANCPNIGECFSKKTATFLVMGTICTRNCKFCAIENGVPLPLDIDEPLRIAKAVEHLDLNYVVITSVSRDDLCDGGASIFFECIKELEKIKRKLVIEVLTPDFKGNDNSIDIILEANPHIFNHNLETIPRLYSEIRPMADYTKSLLLLQKIKEKNRNVFTKSGIMLGLGETIEEVYNLLEDLRSVNCDIVTIGQYLRPSDRHVEVKDYVHPEVFEKIKIDCNDMGFKHIASAPLIRSSYNASSMFNHNLSS